MFWALPRLGRDDKVEKCKMFFNNGSTFLLTVHRGSVTIKVMENI